LDFKLRRYLKIGDADGAADVTTESNDMVVTRRRYTLEKLIGGITEANRHGETGWGPPVGGGVW
jgi:hypothetical protein